jgi:hypothetical protein
MDGIEPPLVNLTAPATGSTSAFTLSSGWHGFIIKTHANGSGDHFALRLTDAGGADLTDLEYQLADPIAPTVASATPVDGATNVELWSEIQFVFSEPMDTSLNPNSVVSITGGSVAGTWAWTDSYVLTFTPSSVWQPGATYAVTLNGSATDLSGNALAIETYHFSAVNSVSAPVASSLNNPSLMRGLYQNLVVSGSGFMQGGVIHPAGAIPFAGHYYQYHNQMTNWLNAKALGAAQNGHLVTPTSNSEDDFVWRFGGFTNNWIGLTDEAVEGTFVWITGESTAYTHWAPGEPADGGNEDYGIYWWGFQWNDVPSDPSSQRPYVTEFDQLAIPTLVFKKNGQPDITPTNVRYLNNGALSFDIDTNTAALGAWDLMLTNPDGGATTLQNALIVDITGPQVTALSPAPNSITPNPPSAITATFSRSIDPASVTSANVKLVRAGPDGVFDTADDVSVPYAGLSLNAATLTIDLTGTPLPANLYRITLLGGPISTSNSGLAAYWKFNEGSGTTIADSSGNGRTGTLHNGVWTGGVAAQALQFNGNNTYVDLNAGNVPPPWSASLWVNRQNSTNPSADMMTSDSDYLKLEQYNNLKKVGFTRLGIGDYAFNYTAPAGTWTHLTYVCNGSNTSLYVKGALQDTLNVAIYMPMKTIGATYNSINGSLDEFRVYNRALSVGEISQLSAVGIKDTNGHTLDGEFSGGLPSGDGIAGGDFTATFAIGTLQVTSLAPAPNAALASLPTSIVAAFSQAVDPSGLNPSTVKLVRAGGDGLLGTGDDVLLSPASISVSNNSITLDLIGVALPNDAYKLSLKSGIQPVSTASQRGYWVCDEGKGSVLADASNNGNTGILNGTTGWAAGIGGSGLKFFDNGGFVSVPASAGALGTGDFTVTAWINTTDNSFDIIGNRHTVGHGAFWTVMVSSGGKLQLEIDQNSSGTNYNSVTGSTTVNNGNWHHLAITRTGAALKLYVDGVLDATSTGPGTANCSGGTVVIGDNPYINKNTKFGGSLDEIRIFGRLLLLSEIQTLAAFSPSGICNLNNQALDGEPNANLPSGNGTAGGDFASTFTIAVPQLHVTALSASPGATFVNPPANITATFDQNVDPSSVNAATVKLVRAGVDGVLGTGDDISVLPASIAAANNMATLNLSGASLPNDLYRLSFKSGSQAISTASQLGYWTCDESQGGSLIDASSNGNNGSLNGTVNWAAGLGGSALQFVDNGGYVILPAAAGALGTSNFTVSTWIKTTDTSFDIIGNRHAVAHGAFWTLMVSPAGKLNLEIDQDSAGNNYNSLTGNTAVNTGTWHHVAITRTGATIALYVDGIPDATSDGPGTANCSSGGTVVIGDNPFTNQNKKYNGLIDEIRIFGRQLSIVEIQTLASFTPSGVCSASNQPLDGELNANFPSGNGTPGGDFVSTFSIAVPPPQITALSPAPNAALTSPLTTVTATFSQNLDPASVTASSFSLTGRGPDNIFGTVDDTVVIPNNINVSGNTATLNVSNISMPNDTYQIAIRGGTGSAPANGLVGRWALDEGSGTVASDSSATPHNGDLINSPTWTTGTHGSALQFNGSNTFVNVPNSVDLGGGSFTLAAWIWRDGGVERKFLDKWNDNSGNFQFSFQVYQDSKLWLSIRQSNGAEVVPRGTTAIGMGQWYHVAAVADAATHVVTFYINGVPEPLQYDPNWDGTVRSVAMEMNIGSKCSNWDYWQGKIDGVHVYNRALSQSEVQNVMSVAVTNLGGTVLDGEPNANFPSGNGSPGGDYTTTFTLNVPPLQVIAMSPSPNAILANPPSSVVLTLNRSPDVGSINSQSVKLVRAGPDGIFDSLDDVVVNPTSLSLNGSNLTLDLSGVSLPKDKYRIVLGGSIAGNLATNSNFMSVPNFGLAMPQSELTIEFWQKFDGGQFHIPTSFGFEPLDSNNYCQVHSPWNSYDYFFFRFGVDTYAVQYVNTRGAWFHIAVVQSFANGYAKIYLNGELLSTQASSQKFTPYAAALQVPRSGAQPFLGEMDEFRIWNVVRTPEQIRANYKRSLNGTESGLLAYWNFNENNSITALDRSPNGYHGTMLSPGRATSDVPLTPAVTSGGMALDGEFNGIFPSGDGNTGGEFNAEFTYDPAPPKVTALSFTPGQALASNPASIVATFNTNIAPASVTASSFSVQGSGPDGVFDTADDLKITPAGVSVSGNTATLDLSGVSMPVGTYTLRLSGSQAGSALAFDQGVVASVLSLGNTLPKDEVTVEFWQYAASSFSNPATFGLSIDDVSNRFQAHVPWPDGKVYWDFGDINTIGRLSYTPPVNIMDSWQHFAFVNSKSGNYMRIYRNGVLEAEKTGAGNFSNVNADFLFGSDGAPHHFIGTLDELRIWSTARTAAEIQSTLHRSLAGTEPGLFASWSFDEGSGQILHDKSPAARDGTLGRTTSVEPGGDATWVPSNAALFYGVKDTLGILLDGEPNANFPSGNGTAGGDFTASFSLLPTTVAALSPAPNALLVNPPTSIVATFSRNINPASVTKGSFSLIGRGPDGVFDTADDVVIIPASVSVNANTATLDLTGVQVPSDVYRVLLAGGPAIAPSTGLVNHWSFDEGVGTVAADTGSGGANGTIHGAVWAAGQIGNALYFNGVDNYINTELGDLPPPWTFGVWVKREASGHIDAYLMSSLTSGNVKVEQYPNLGVVGVSKFNVEDHPFNYVAPVGQWVHLTFLGTNGGTKLYVNGIYQDTTTLALNLPRNILGASHFADYSTKGTLDDFRIYNYALTDAEILHLGQSGITDLNGNSIDGEPHPTFPSGNGTPGGDFSSTFTIAWFPVVDNQTLITPPGVAKAITLTSSNPNNGTLNWTIVTPPAHGALSGTAPNLTYTPNGTYTTSDSFTVKNNDGTQDSNTATVSIVAPATVIALSPAPGAIIPTSPANITATFNQNIDPSRVNASNFSVVGSGPDGIFDTVDDVHITPAGVNTQGSTVTLDLTGVTLAPDVYRVKLVSGNGDVGWGGSNRCLSFDGVNNYCTSPQWLTGTGTTATVECWCKPTTNGWGNLILHKAYFNDLNFGWSFVAGQPQGKFFLHFPLDRGGEYTAPDLQLNQWYHVAGVYDGSNVKLYVNGQLKMNVSSPGTINWDGSYTNSYLGGMDDPWGGKFPGLMDEVRIWNVARTQAQIQASMNAELSGPQSGLQAYYKMNEGSGQTLTDSSGNGRHARLGLSTAVASDDPSWLAISGMLDVNGNAIDGEPNASLPSGDGTPGGDFTATFTIPQNPIANSQSVATVPGVAKAITLTASNPQNGILAWTIVDSPAHGALSGTAPNLTYTPDGTYTNADSFTFKVNDGFLDSNVATVTISVPTVVTALSPAPGAVLTTPPASISVTFSQNIDAASVTASTLKLVRRGPDGTFDTADDSVVTPETVTVTGNVITLGLAASLPNDDYKIKIHSGNSSAPSGAGGRWQFDEGGSSAADSSGNNNTGTFLNGASHAAGKWDSGAALDGINDYVSISNSASVNPTSAWTLAAWIRLNSTGAQQAIMEKYDPVLGTGSFAMRVHSDGHLAGLLLNNPNRNTVTSSQILNAGTWYHVAVTYDSAQSALKAYINGQLDGSITTTLTQPASNNPLKIGARGDDSGTNLGGVVDDACIYGRALTLSEIGDLMQSVAGGGVKDVNGQFIDGEPNAQFPSGDGNSGGDFTATFTVNTPLTAVTALSPAPGAVLSAPPASVTVTFSQDVDAATLAGNITLVGAGPDGQFDTADDRIVVPAAVNTNGKIVTLDVTGVSMPNDTYRLKLYDSVGAGSAVSFNTNKMVKIPGFGLVIPPNEITIEFWQRESATSQSVTFGMNPDDQTNRFNGHFPWYNNQIYWDYGNYVTGPGRLEYASPNIQDSWHHFTLVASASGNFMKLYRNGVLEASKTGVAGFTPVLSDLWIGRDGTQYSFAGQIDEFRIWNKARSAQEIAATWNRTLSGNETGLISCWSFDEGSGQIVHDRTIGAHDGTLGDDANPGADDPAWVVSGAPILTGIKDVYGNAVDGEPNAQFPSGNATAGGDFIAMFTVNAPPLQVTGLSITPGSLLTASPTTITATFSQNVDSASVAVNNFRLVGRGPDGNFDTADDVIIDPTGVSASGTMATLDLNGKTLPPDTYRVMLSGGRGITPSSGIAALWKFDEGNGTNVADGSGNGKNGTMSGATWIAGIRNNALSFPITGGVVDINSADIAPPWTATVWVKRQDSTRDSSRLASSSAFCLKLEQYSYTKKVGFTVQGSRDYPFNYTAPIDTWVHLGFVGTSTGVSLYVNGELKDAINVPISMPMTSISHAIESVSAALDEFCVYNRALTPSEIGALAATGITDLYGNPLDGEPHANFPSGNGTPGGDYTATFRVNALPVAFNQAFSIHAGTSYPVSLGGSDVENDPLTFAIVSQPAHGALSGTAPFVTYTPAAGFVGSDSFTFKANDGYGDGAPAMVSFDVYNNSPVAISQSVTTHFNRPTPITLSGTDADNDALSFTLFTAPLHGVLTGNPPNVFYFADNGYVGGDSFSFQVSDGLAQSSPATVSITVTNAGPSVTVTASPTSVVPNDPVTFNGAGLDPDGDVLTYFWDFGDGANSTEQNPAHGYAQVGTYTATLTVTDPAGLSASASIIIQVSKAPIVRLTTDEVAGFGGIPLLFDASYSTDPENQIASYDWDFGDGTPHGSGQIISKVYDIPGTYTVTLTVTDAAGVSSTLVRVIEVLSGDEIGLFNGYIKYKVAWNRHADNKDALNFEAGVNVGNDLIRKGTSVTLEIVGHRFTGTLDQKLRDYRDANKKWQVKAQIRHQPFGTVIVKANIKHASLGLAFNQAGAIAGGDPHDIVSQDIPVHFEIGGHSYEMLVPTDFKFSGDRSRAKGDGASE